MTAANPCGFHAAGCGKVGRSEAHSMHSRTGSSNFLDIFYTFRCFQNGVDQDDGTGGGGGGMSEGDIAYEVFNDTGPPALWAAPHSESGPLRSGTDVRARGLRDLGRFGGAARRKTPPSGAT